MKRKILSVVFTSCILSLAFMYGCSGSSSSDGGFAASEGSYGKVGVLITDGPADDYDSIFVTITDVSLLPAGCEDDCDPVTLFHSDDGVEIDLLKYRDEDFLLALNEEVPTGTYEKIRLVISDITPIGGPCDEMEIKLPSGKIDLNPQDSITIEAGDSLYIRLDIDANKSIQLHTAGNSGKCIFRPVVFVDIFSDVFIPACHHAVRGSITELILSDDESTVEGFVLRRNPSCLGTLRVQFDDETRIFTENGVFAGSDALAVDQKVIVWGMLLNGDLHASLIVIGDALFLNGTVGESTEEGFTLVPDVLDGIAGPVPINILDETVLLAGCQNPVDPDYLEPGMRVLVIGKFIMDDTSINAAVVFIKDWEISGYVDSVEPAYLGYWFTLVSQDEDPVIKFIPYGSEIRFTGDGLISEDMIGLLSCGHNLVTIKKEGPDVDVQVQPSTLYGTVESPDSINRTIMVDDMTVGVMPYATIIDISDDADTLISFDEIGDGDEIICFGLETCEDSLVDFYAYVVILDIPEED
jgi:hypothetical protein